MGDLPRLVCASANPDKVAEIALVLDGLVDLLPGRLTWAKWSKMRPTWRAMPA